MAVNGINLVSPVIPMGTGLDKGIKIEGGSESVSFADYLKGALNKVSNLQVDAEQIANDFAASKTENIHQVMIASEKAEIALQFTMQVRNKIMDAYSEIMRMQI